MSLLAAVKQALEALEQSDVEGRNKVLRNLRAAIETAEKAEPVYQVWERFEYPSHWRDTDEQEYNREKEDDRRILYTHPAPAPEGMVSIELAAIEAWNHYADTCKKLGLNPHHHGEWIASDAIRALAAAPKPPEGK